MHEDENAAEVLAKVHAYAEPHDMMGIELLEEVPELVDDIYEDIINLASIFNIIITKSHLHTKPPPPDID